VVVVLTMQMKKAWRLAALPAALAVVTNVCAQTPPPIAPPAASRPVQDPAQQLIDQQREAARQRQLAEPPAQISVTPQGGDTPLNIPLDTPVDRIPEPGPTFRVEHIVLTGPEGRPPVQTAVPQSTFDAITAAFAGHEIGSHRLNVLLRRLTDAYVSAGYVTTRAVLGPQNIGTGM
jgi:hemolysin activation/secretion protein